MYRRIASIACALVATAAVAPASVRSIALYQPVSEVSGGWIWYLNKDTVRADGVVRQFWLTGDNRGTGAVRQSMMHLKVDCSTGMHIPLLVASFDANGRNLTRTYRGDAPANLVRIAAGTPVAAARPWVCR